MKYSIKYWNLKLLVLGIILIAAGAIEMSINIDTQTSIIVSVSALFVGLIVCLCIRPVQNNVEVCGVPIIRENLYDISINYKIPGISKADVDKALDALEAWKKENEFNWIEHKDEELIVIFKDISKTQTGIVSMVMDTQDSRIERERTKEYSGVFKYYMDNGARKFKVGDLQLGELNIGVIDDLNKVKDKLCHITIIDDTIVDCIVMEG